MKNVFLLCIAFIASSTIYAQNNGEPMALGLPGDNLNLYAILNIFQQSKTLEDFERAINDQSNNINNLDLNNDQNIDYLKVVGHQVSNTHTIVIQDPINETEVQDVAVIEVSKEASGKVFIQIIGDESLYGKDYIIEPSDIGANGTPNPGYNASSGTVVNNNVYQNNYRPVDDWLIVSFLFSSAYVTYHSPFYWGYYPTYWHPWQPVFYENYWGYNRHYYRDNYYQRSIVVRSPVYYSHYAPRRISSPIVVRNYNNGGYRGTYNGHDYRKPEGFDHHNNTPRVNNNHQPRANNINNPRPRENNNNINPRYNNNSNPRNNNTGHVNTPGNSVPQNNSSNPRSSQPANNNVPANHSPSAPVQSGQQHNNAPRTNAPAPRASSPRPAATTPKPAGRDNSGEGRR